MIVCYETARIYAVDAALHAQAKHTKIDFSMVRFGILLETVGVCQIPEDERLRAFLRALDVSGVNEFDERKAYLCALGKFYRLMGPPPKEPAQASLMVAAE